MTGSGWVVKAIGDVLELQRGFDITKADQNAGSIPVISSSGISSYNDRSMVDGPGVVMGRKGTLGKVFYSTEPFWPHDTTLWVRDFKGNDPRFVYYFLQTLDFLYMNVGSANPTLNRNHVHPLKTLWPPLSVQKAIAEVLGALDDKIAANRTTLATVDGLLRAKYQEIPRPWTCVLSDLATNHREQVSLDEIRGDDRYLGLEHFDHRSIWLSRRGRGTDIGSAKNAFARGDCLFGKLRPYFHKVAIPGYGGVCSTDILVLRAKDLHLRWIVMASASSDDVVASAVQNSNGTKMPRAHWEDIASSAVPNPAEPAARKFSKIAGALIERCWVALDENERLSSTRDELLPLLMNGTITVRQAEKRVSQEV